MTSQGVVNLNRHCSSMGKTWLRMLFGFLLLGTCSAQKVDTIACDHLALAKMISGFCVGEYPNGSCCTAVINVVDRGIKEPCACRVMTAGVKMDMLVRTYKACRGKNPAVNRLNSLCTGAPPPPTQGDGEWSPSPSSRGHHVIIGLLLFTIIVLSGWLIFELWKRNSQRSEHIGQGITNDIEMDVLNRVSEDEELDIRPQLPVMLQVTTEENDEPRIIGIDQVSLNRSRRKDRSKRSALLPVEK